jgi:hypothetical protein
VPAGLDSDGHIVWVWRQTSSAAGMGSPADDGSHREPPRRYGAGLRDVVPRIEHSEAGPGRAKIGGGPDRVVRERHAGLGSTRLQLSGGLVSPRPGRRALAAGSAARRPRHRHPRRHLLGRTRRTSPSARGVGAPAWPVPPTGRPSSPVPPTSAACPARCCSVSRTSSRGGTTTQARRAPPAATARCT